MNHRMQVSRQDPTMTERLKPWRPPRSGLRAWCASCADRAAESSCAWWTPLMEVIAERHIERDDGRPEPFVAGPGHPAAMAARRPLRCGPVRAGERPRGVR